MLRRFPKYNLTVGSYEEITPSNHDTILNVSDSPCWLLDPKTIKDCGCSYHWYPIDEMSKWGLGPFFWSKRLLDDAFERGDRIGIHCHAGAHRSPIIALAWMWSKEESFEATLKLFEGQDWSFSVNDAHAIYIGRAFDRDLRAGTVPNDLDKLHYLMDKHPTYSLMGIRMMLYK